MNDILQDKIRLLPESPGCYIMKSGGFGSSDIGMNAGI